MISERLARIFTSEEMKRLQIIDSESKIPSILADVHGMTCHQARRFIRNIINVLFGKLQLIIIHGFNHGVAIKTMLSQNFENRRISQKYVDPNNPGLTYMLIIPNIDL